MLSPATSEIATFQELVGSTQHCLMDQARRLERSEACAWDLVQDTFERGLRYFHTFRPGTNPRAWLLSIMRNLFIDRCRRGVRERPCDPWTLNDLPTPESESPSAWEDIGPDEVHTALVGLAPRFQAVLDLHFNHQRSYAEIAEHLGIPPSTVGTRLNRARHKMKTLLLEPRSRSVDAGPS